MKFGKMQPEASKNRNRTKAQQFNAMWAKETKFKGKIDQHIMKHYPLKKRNYGDIEEDEQMSSSDSDMEVLNSHRNVLLRSQMDRLTKRKGRNSKHSRDPKPAEKTKEEQKTVMRDLNNEEVFQPTKRDEANELAIMTNIKYIKSK